MKINTVKRPQNKQRSSPRNFRQPMSANLPACHQDSPQHAAYVARVEELEAEGCDTSDAQGIADMEFDGLLTQPKKPTKPTHKMKTNHIDIRDINYVRSVLAEKVASSVADGDLEPPAGARCRTRSGFRAWLKRAEKEEAIWKAK